MMPEPQQNHYSEVKGTYPYQSCDNGSYIPNSIPVPMGGQHIITPEMQEMMKSMWPPQIQQPNTLKDSGERRDFGTGAVRDVTTNKGRFDLLQVHGILATALQLEAGAKKYSDRNWEKGIPLSSFLDSALRHLLKELAGYDDEPHDRAVAWNILCYLEGKERIRQGLWSQELDDLPHTYKGKQPSF